MTQRPSMPPVVEHRFTYSVEDRIAAPTWSSPKPSDVSWPLFLGWSVLLAAASYLTAFARHAVLSPAEGAGWTIGLLLMSGLIAGVARLSGAKRWRRTLLIAWPICAVLGLLGASDRSDDFDAGKKYLHAAALELQAAARSPVLTHEATSPSQNPAQPAPDVQGVPASGNAAAITALLREIRPLLDAQVQRENAKAAELKALHVETILKPESLVSAAGIASSRERLARYVAIEKGSYEDYLNYVSAAEAKIRTLPEPLRSSVLKGFNDSRFPMDDAMQRFIAVEDRIESSMASMLDLAQANLGRTKAVNGNIYLPADALQKYHALLLLVRKDAAEEQQTKLDVIRLHDEGLKRIDQFVDLTK